jgi:glycosyltransferase involved in cell wall biosynthesis
MKIFLCTTASSKFQKSWSNIPFFLNKSLLESGFSVKNIVLRECWTLAFIYNSFIRIFRRILRSTSTYFYTRSIFHFYLMKLYGIYIEHISSDQDVILQQGFSFPLKNGKNRLVLFGDWPYAYYFFKFSGRSPNWLEKRSIFREDGVIESADAVVTLFPDVYEFMRARYKNTNIFYFGNVVNVDVSVPEDILSVKQASRKILFIGREHYLSGALELIDAVKKIEQHTNNLHLDIVGIPPKMIDINYSWLTVHGYLDKDDPGQKLTYYDLLKEARVYVNPTKGWNAFQATLEAMFFSCPIIVRGNVNLKKSFPLLEDFSYIVDDRNTLSDCLKLCLEDGPLFREKALSAIAASKLHTWKHFIGQLTQKVLQ